MATTGVDVSQFQVPSYDSIAGALISGIQQINNTAEANSARSSAEAKSLRNWQQQQNQIAMDFNAKEAAKNRDWQELMSNTAHQREVADLQAAGLNPILSASGGNGAAVTSGATASTVASSGAKGDVDTSANSAIVSLLASWLSSETKMREQSMSALTNLAVADKYNMTSEYVAQIAAASNMYSADSARYASMYGSDSSRASSKYSSDTSRWLAKFNAQSASDLSRQQHEQNMEYTQKYPSTKYQAAASGARSAGNLIERFIDEFKTTGDWKKKLYESSSDYRNLIDRFLRSLDVSWRFN